MEGTMLIVQGEDSWVMPRALMPLAVKALGEAVKAGEVSRLSFVDTMACMRHTTEGDVAMSAETAAMVLASLVDLSPLDAMRACFADLPVEVDEEKPVGYFCNSPTRYWNRNERWYCGGRRPLKSWKYRTKRASQFKEV
jgi:hypothetical protein